MESALLYRRWRTRGMSTANWRGMWTGWSQPWRDRWTALISLRSLPQWSMFTHTSSHSFIHFHAWVWVGTGCRLQMSYPQTKEISAQRIIHLNQFKSLFWLKKTFSSVLHWLGMWAVLQDVVEKKVCSVHWSESVLLCEQQEKVQIRKELWRIEDVIAGLSTSKANYKVTISSVTNPGEPGAARRFHIYHISTIAHCVMQ